MTRLNHDIRKYQDTDLPTLAKIYSSSIHCLCSEYYSKDQITAWSSFTDDLEEFENWLKQATIFVAVSSDNTCVGFGGFEDYGRISSLFVTPEFGRKGIGSSLLEHLIVEARSREFAVVTTEASEFSKPLFEKFGFSVTEIECTEFKGVKFKRYAMQACI